MASNINEFLRSVDKTQKDMINAIRDGVADTLDNIGIYVSSRFGTRGHLGIRSGDLNRSILGGAGAIRKVQIFGGKIIGIIGTTVNNRGFSYPAFHESRLHYMEEAVEANQGTLIENISRRFNRI